MKKSLFATMLLMLSMFAYAQQNVTQFLGIPVDGSKSEMIRKLKEKGFRDTPVAEFLTGEFNGKEVNISVVTNNNKVWRIAILDANSVDEQDIRIRFNKLCRQFANNPKYMSLTEDQTISDEENIFRGIISNKKRYEAVFYQKGTEMDFSKYTPEQLKEMTKEKIREIGEACLKRSVWFMIDSDIHSYKEYKIIMFYDNKYNQANGEDL